MSLNWPNRLVIIRFFLAFLVFLCLLFVPLTLQEGFTFEVGGQEVSWLNVIALILFLIAASTDFLDGYLARKNNQETNFGKIFDPLADKLLMNIVIIFFAYFNYIPVWLAIIFICRDLMVDGLRIYAAKKDIVISANWAGKWKTFFQILGLAILFIFHPEATTNNTFNYNSIEHLYLIPIYIAAIFSIYSGVFYYVKNWKEIFVENDKQQQ